MKDFPWFECPSNPTRPPFPIGPTHFVGIAGLGADSPMLPKGHVRAGIFGYDRATTFADITDGLSNTMMVVETSREIGPWTAGGRASIRGLDPSKPPYIGKRGQFGGNHRGGANVLMADGSVKFLSDTVNPHFFEAISTISGGEVMLGDTID